MNNETFNWKPDANQIYSEETDTTLEGQPQQFNKLSGKAFTMEAPSQTLTLKVTEATEEAKMTTWGQGEAPEPTVAKFYYGTLVYDANNTESAFFLSGPQTTQLIFHQDGKFMIKNGFMVMTDNPLKVELHNHGIFDIATNGLAMGGVVSVKIFEEAKVAMRTDNAFSMTHAYFEVASTGNSNNALTLTSDGRQGLLLDDVTAEFSQQASGLLRAPLLDCDRLSQIRAESKAQVNMEFDDFNMKGGSSFILAYGEAQMTFSGYTEGKKPFDFLNREYPEGLFNFITESGSNNGEFRFNGPDFTAFDASALADKGYVAINGEPQYNHDRIDVTFEQGVIILKLR